MPAPTRPPEAIRQVDLTGEVCPMTFVKAKLHLEQLPRGEALEFVLQAGEQMRNVPRSIKEEGHRIESVRQEDGRYYLLVRKGEAEPPTGGGPQ